MRRYRLFLLIFIATAISMKMATQFYTLRPEVVRKQVKPVKQIVTKQNVDSVDTKHPDVTFQTDRSLEITIEKDVPLFVNVKDSLFFNLISRHMNVCLPLGFLKINSAFGYRKDPVSECIAFHDGTDLQCNHAQVYAMLPSIIKEVHFGSRGCSNYVVLEHGIFECLYRHLDQITVRAGDAVSAGTVAGISGNTGKSTGPRLHIEIRKGRKSVDLNTSVDYLSGYVTQSQDKMVYVRFRAKPDKELSIKSLMTVLRRYDMKFSQIVAAQALFETGYFTSRVCSENNSLFRLHHPGNGGYCTFNSWEESMKAYEHCVQYKYREGSYYGFLNKVGYAEDQAYLIKMKKIVGSLWPLHKEWRKCLKTGK